MSGYEIAISGLNVARQALQIIGNNIANAATDGYHRQEPIISPLAADPMAVMPVGLGAEVTGIRRTGNTLLETEIWKQRPELGQADQEQTILASLESILGDMATGGLASAISDFFSALEELASEPDSPAFREKAIGASYNLATQFRVLGEAIGELKEQILREARQTADQINDLAGRIASANTIVRDLQARACSDANLLDIRDRALTELTDLAGVRLVTGKDGSYNVYAWGTPLVLGSHLTEIQVDHTGLGTIGVSVKGANHYDCEAHGGRLGGLLALYNELLPAVKDDLDTLAAEIISRVNALHAEGVGRAGSFDELTGWRMAQGPIADWAMPVSAGDIHVRLIDTATGQAVRYTVTIADPLTETLANIAAKFNAVQHLSASVTEGRLNLVAEAGYKFDFLPVVTADPASSTLTGTAAPTLSGVYAGATNQTLTATVVGTGQVGVTAGLTIEVRNAGGDLLRTLNVGLGYEAGEPLDLGDGLFVSMSGGTLNAGEQFTIEALSRSDPTGFLAAAGVNALFSGTTSDTMGLVSRIRTDASCLATSLGTPGLDNLNLRRMIGVGETPLADLDNDVPADAFRAVITRVGHWVALREARSESLQNLLEELTRQRNDTSGVDINEEAATMLTLERMFQGMAKYLAAVDRTHQYLMDLV